METDIGIGVGVAVACLFICFWMFSRTFGGVKQAHEERLAQQNITIVGQAVVRERETQLADRRTPILNVLAFLLLIIFGLVWQLFSTPATDDDEEFFDEEEYSSCCVVEGIGRG